MQVVQPLHLQQFGKPLREIINVWAWGYYISKDYAFLSFSRIITPMHFKSLYFDLDDTLYPANSGLWVAIRERMNAYMQRIIDLPIDDIISIRQKYLETYGTTLRGLQAHFDVDRD